MESFRSRMKKHGFLVDHLGENRLSIRHGPKDSSRLIIEIDTPGIRVVEVTEDFVRHCFARSGRLTLKQFIIGALRESGIIS
ncbi:MAG: hypothetical protein Kow0025_21890 [Thermodesulfovibrionales bacterium]